MDINQAFCIRGSSDRHHWGNSTIEHFLTQFPWLGPFVKTLQTEQGLTEQELRLLRPHYGLFFLDRRIEGPRISFEIRRKRSHKAVVHLTFLGDPAPDPHDVIRSIPLQKSRRRSV